jgi:hypothetical protein
MRIRLLVAGTYIALVGLVLLAGTGGAGALVIDDFSTDLTAILVLGAPDSTSSQVSGAGILGGERDMVVTLISDPFIVMAASGNTLNYLQAGNSEGTGLIVWDGANDDPILHPTDLDPTGLDATGLGGVDFTDGGTEDKIAIPLLSSNLPAPMVLTAYTNGTDYSRATVLLPGGAPPQQRAIVLFTSFVADPGGAGADFTNIGAFSIFIDGSTTQGLNAEFDSVVPEPSTATLLLFGILGIVAIRRCGWVP